MATQQPHISVIIPVLNEAASIGKVLADLPKEVATVLVVDNGSSDGTADIARVAGATVVYESRRGYGSACLKGIANLPPITDVVVFMDGDYSDFPEELTQLVTPVLQGNADLVIGSRVLGKHEPGSLLPVARFGNWLSTTLIRLRWGIRFTDLGPFRAIDYRALTELGMSDPDFGWTVEMQIKASAKGLRCAEIPVRYRKRIGVSKISGTILGSFHAGKKILWLIAREGMIRKRL